MKPRRTPAPKTAWTLVQVVGGQRAIVGQYATALKGQTAAAQVMAKECGVKTIRRVPPWVKKAEAWELIYGRDAHSFRFRVEPGEGPVI